MLILKFYSLFTKYLEVYSQGELIDDDDSFLINSDAKEIVEEINDMLGEGFSDLDF